MVIAGLAAFSLATVSARPLIIPRPKEARWASETWELPDRLTLVIGRNPLHRMAAEAISREIVENGGRRPFVTTRLMGSKNVVLLGEPSASARFSRLLNGRARVPANPEGYWLCVKPGQAIIAGRTPQATFYGAQTLCQMLRKQGSGVGVGGAVIRDYPSLRWRGAHLFVGNTALPFHKKLIANVFSRFKMNRLVLQCEQAKWDSTRNAAPEWAMSKKDLAAEVRFAKGHGLQVIPLVSSVGHMRWLLENAAFRDLREDPSQAFNISPSNPRTYRLLFRLYDEVLGTFHPSVIHIGGDEMMYGGRYPLKSAAKLPTVSKAYLYQIKRIQRHLRSRGVNTMLWADMMLPHGKFPDAANAPSEAEAVAIRNGMPKGIELVDWHYGIEKDLDRLKAFESSGFHDVIGATWKWPRAIRKYSGKLSERGHRGLLQTTWVGFNSQEKNIQSYPEAFAAFVVAAEESWNGGAVPLEELGYDPLKVFQAAYRMQP